MNHSHELFGAARSALAADTSLPAGWRDDPALRQYVWDHMERAATTRAPIGRFVGRALKTPRWCDDAETQRCPGDAGASGDVVVWGVRRCAGIFFPAQRPRAAQAWAPWLRGWLLDAVEEQLGGADPEVSPWLCVAQEHARVVRASLSVRRARVRRAMYWDAHERLRVALWRARGSGRVDLDGVARVLGAVAGSVERPESLVRGMRHELIAALIATQPEAPDAAWCAAQRALWMARLEVALGAWITAQVRP